MESKFYCKITKYVRVEHQNLLLRSGIDGDCDGLVSICCTCALAFPFDEQLIRIDHHDTISTTEDVTDNDQHVCHICKNILTVYRPLNICTVFHQNMMSLQ